MRHMVSGRMFRILGLVAAAGVLASCQSSGSSSYGGTIGQVERGRDVLGSASTRRTTAQQKAQAEAALKRRQARRDKRNQQRRRAGLKALPQIKAGASGVSAYAAVPTKRATIAVAPAKTKRKKAASKASKRKAVAELPRSKATKKKIASKSAKAPRIRGKGKAAFRTLIAKHARANGVPVKLALAVVQIESTYNPRAKGAAGEIGLMQIMPRTARFIGYKGKMSALYNPDTNLRYGMKYLGKAYRLGGKTPCGAILKYNAGHGAKKWNPISRKYCTRVKRIMGKG